MITIFRYIRPKHFNIETCALSPNTNGGIAFMVQLDAIHNQMHFSFARCRNTESFCQQTSKKLLARNFKENKFYTINEYDSSISLVDNINAFIKKNKENKQLLNLYTNIKEIKKINKAEEEKLSDLVRSVSANVFSDYYM